MNNSVVELQILETFRNNLVWIDDSNYFVLNISTCAIHVIDRISSHPLDRRLEYPHQTIFFAVGFYLVVVFPSY